MATQQSLNEYNNARRQGRKYFSEHAGRNGETGYLPVLEDIIDMEDTVGEINLGLHEIPLKKIVGTYTSARSNAFAGNFMPLLDEGTEFAFKWQSLYLSHIDEGIRDPIKVYEYLNCFYVLEGNKRVSVLNYVDAYSIHANVIRLVPKRDSSDPRVEIYYEFLDYNAHGFYFNDMWFSQKGTFTELIRRAREFAENNEELRGKEPHEWLPAVYRDFARHYSVAGYRDLDITTGDAFFEYVKIYGFPYKVPYDELAEKVKNCGAQFSLIAGKGAATTIESADVQKKSGGFRLFSIISRKPEIIFAYRSTPETSSWTRAHELGRRHMEKYFDGKVKTEAVFGISTENAHEDLARVAERKPDLLFTVNSVFDHASLQIALENPDTIVFNCNHTQTSARLNTYFCKLYEFTFLLGAMAASFTKTDILGFIDPPLRTSQTTYSVNAFALGARLVNHNVSVKRCILNTNFSGKEDANARRLLAEKGADVVFCQYPTDDPISPKSYDNLYGMLCQVNRNGSIIEYLAAPEWRWERVYRKIVGDYLDGNLDMLRKDGAAEGNSIHFWLGFSARAINVLNVEAAVGTHTSRLGNLLKNDIAHSHLHPFTGPIHDVDGNLRVGKYDVLTVNDIKDMNWLCDIVDETVSFK